MKSLLRVDLYKLSKSKVMKLLFIFTCFSAGLLVYFAHKIALGEMTATNSLVGFFSDLQVFSLVGSVVMGLFFCEDFEDKVIESAIATGHQRWQLVCSKVISLFLLTSLFAFPYCVALLLASYSKLAMVMYLKTPFLNLIELTTTNANIWQLTVSIIMIVFIYTAQLSLGIPILFLIKKPVLVMILMYSLLGLLGNLLSMTGIVKDILHWTPYGLNFFDLINHFSLHYLVEAVSVSAVFISVMLGLTLLVFRKAEIK